MFDRTYLDTKTRVVDIARSLSEDQLNSYVAACPEWTARDVLAHLTGVAADLVHGRVENITKPVWTAPQVASRKDRTVEELAAEWGEHAPVVAATLAEGDGSLKVMYDAFTHEADLRETFGLGRPPQTAVDMLAGTLGRDVVGNFTGSGTLVVQAGELELTGGHGQPRIMLTIDPYELVRGVISRRSRSQMRAWDWAGCADLDELIDRLPVFGVREDDQPVPV